MDDDSHSKSPKLPWPLMVMLALGPALAVLGFLVRPWLECVIGSLA